MTKAVVDDLEAIQVNEQNSEEVACPAPAVIGGQVQVINEESTVGQPGQRVMESVMKQLLFRAPPFRDVSRKDLRGGLPPVCNGGHYHLDISRLAVQPHEFFGFQIRLLTLS
jgi:hypothetical protein